jgi:hypothetical protein
VIDRCAELGEILTQKLTCLTAAHLAARWDIDSASGRWHLDRWLAARAAEGLLVRHCVLARLTPPLDAPLWASETGGEPADPGHAVAWRLARRWATTPLRVIVYTAGRRLARIYGGQMRGGLGNPDAISHDLALAALYVRFAATRPEAARDWVPDFRRAAAAGYGEKQPDVLLFDADGTPYRAVELAGIYSAGRLAALAAHCRVGLGLPLEVW